MAFDVESLLGEFLQDFFYLKVLFFYLLVKVEVVFLQ